MNEVKAIEAVANALDPLDPEERARVLGWAQLKYGVPAQVGFAHQSPAKPVATPAATSPAPGAAKAKTPKKTKTILSMDKGLNLSPAGKVSAVDFATEKVPANGKEKCVVAVHYLRDVIEVEKVTAQGVLTFFKTVGWPVPADLKNMLQQAGTEGWLDTADSNDIKLTSSGENLVEHKLPGQAKAKAK